GVRPVGHGAVVLAIGALLPVAVMVAVGLATPGVAPWTPVIAEGQSLSAGLGLGLAVVMWNYSGWDTPSTCLGETRAPEQAFRRALLLALPVIAAAYLLPMAVALSSGGLAWSEWTTGVLPRIAEAMGGPWLGHAVAAGAVLSTAGLFLSLLLTNSRLPYVLARDGNMPPALGRVHHRFGTPWVAVTASSTIYALFAVFSFKDLIVLNVWLYSLSLMVELAAFLWLRRVAPDLPRPWRVPGGWGAAFVVAGLPGLFVVAAMATAGWMNTAAGVAAALTGPLAWVGLRRGRPSDVAADARRVEYPGGREDRQ
ncbi:MAG: APC family permease, partial [Candidatus Rokuibacteriota bacterium]